MAGIVVRAHEPIDKALRRFKRVCEKEGIMSALKKKQYFEKPSERRKRKMNAGKWRSVQRERGE